MRKQCIRNTQNNPLVMKMNGSGTHKIPISHAKESIWNTQNNLLAVPRDASETYKTTHRPCQRKHLEHTKHPISHAKESIWNMKQCVIG